MKKLLVIVLIICLVMSLGACGKPSDTVDPDAKVEFLVVLLTDKNGIEDNGLNASCWNGLLIAAEEFEMKVNYVEPKDGYAEAIKEAVELKPDLIICPNPDIADVLDAVSEQYVNQLFVVFDAEFPEAFNITTATFNQEERAFLAGMAAALYSKKDVVGFIGYDNDEVTKRYLYGYTAGVVSTDTKVYISTNYISRDAGVKGAKRTAVAQYKLGADAIFHVLGNEGAGIMDAADERGFKAISLYQETSIENIENRLCTIVQNGEMVCYDIVKKLIEGSFDGSNLSYSLADDAFYVSNDAELLDEEMLETIEKKINAVKEGRIVVPYDNLSYQTFINGGQSSEDLSSGVINTDPEMDIQ